MTRPPGAGAGDPTERTKEEQIISSSSGPRTLLLGLSILAGAAAGIASLPALYRTVPHDLHRHGAILEGLRTRRPSVVVFGDSRGEAGINARLIAPNAMNVAARGETPLVSYLLKQELPGSVTTIVELVSYDRLTVYAPLTGEPAPAIFLFGYRTNAKTLATIERCYGLDARRSLESIDPTDGRWVVRGLPDLLVTRLRHPEIAPARQRDLVAPRTFAERIPAAQFAAQVESRRTRAPRPIAAEHRAILTEMARDAAARGRRFVLVAAPVHPQLRGPGEAKLLETLRAIPHAAVVDATTLLDDADFSDPAHANAAGARKLSAFIGAHLR